MWVWAPRPVGQQWPSRFSPWPASPPRCCLVLQGGRAAPTAARAAPILRSGGVHCSCPGIWVSPTQRPAGRGLAPEAELLPAEENDALLPKSACGIVRLHLGRTKDALLTAFCVPLWTFRAGEVGPGLWCRAPRLSGRGMLFRDEGPQNPHLLLLPGR